MRRPKEVDPARADLKRPKSGPKQTNIPDLQQQNNPFPVPQLLPKPEGARENKVSAKATITFGKILVRLALVFCPLLLALSNDPFMSAFMTPVCKRPLVSKHISYCDSILNRPVLVPPDFHQLASLQTRLEEVMDDSLTSSLAAADIRNSEMAVRDLTKHVELSSMISKDSLVDRINKFVDSAKTATKGLQGFSGGVRGAVDQIVSTNEGIVMLIESSIKDTHSQLPTGPVQYIMDVVSGTKYVGPELILRDQEKLDTAWRQATGLLESRLKELIHEAKSNIVALGRLEKDLNAIYDAVVTEEKNIFPQIEELSSSRWTKLGNKKNQELLRNFNSDREVLDDIRTYRKRALMHVSNTLDQLNHLYEDLRRQRKRVFAATITPPSKDSTIPLEFHLASMQKRTEQLVGGQKRLREREAAYLRRS